MLARHTLKRLRPVVLTTIPSSSTFLAPLVDAAQQQPLTPPCLPPHGRFCRRFLSSDDNLYMDVDKDGIKERFDPTRTETEWKEFTSKCLDPLLSPVGSLSSQNLVAAEETIRWWTTQRTVQGVNAAFLLYERMAVELEENPDLLETEDMIYWLDGRYPRATHLLNAALDAWRIVWEETGATLPPEQVLLSVERFASATPPVLLNDRTYSIIMNAAVKRGDPGTPIFTERILETMLVNSQINPAVMPDIVAFTTAVRAWAISTRPDAAQRAEGLWLEMLSLHDDRVIDATPNTVLYNTVLSALVRTRQFSDMERADEILRQMLTSPYQDVYPDTVTFRLVVYGWTELDDPLGVDRAYLLVQEMLRIYETGSASLELDSTFFSKLISTLARFDSNLDKAESIYQELVALYERTGDACFEPDVYATRAMIIVYAKQGRPEKAEPLLERLEHEALSSGDLKMMPKRGHYRDVLLAWMRSSDNDAVDRAERILVRMTDIATRGDEDMVPDNRSINSVLRMWSNTSRRHDAAMRAESLFRTMQNLHNHTKHKSYRMGHPSFLCVMNAWSRSKAAEAPDRAEALLFELQRRYEDGEVDLRPNRFNYSSAITAWARSGRHDTLDSVQDIFDEAVDAYEAGYDQARPDTALYGAAIYACRQSGDGHRAEHYLQRMLKDFKQGNESAKPTSKVFNMVLLSWVRSKDLNAPERARAIIHLMEEMTRRGEADVRPDETSARLVAEILSNSPSPRDNNNSTANSL